MSTLGPKFFEFDFEDGDIAIATELPIAPFGKALFIAADNSSDSRLDLEELIKSWDKLWPKMLKKLQREIENYGTETDLMEDRFIGSLQRCDTSHFMGNRSKLFLQLEFEEPPLWDFFLRGRRIIHFQPVF